MTHLVVYLVELEPSGLEVDHRVELEVLGGVHGGYVEVAARPVRGDAAVAPADVEVLELRTRVEPHVLLLELVEGHLEAATAVALEVGAVWVAKVGEHDGDAGGLPHRRDEGGWVGV